MVLSMKNFIFWGFTEKSDFQWAESRKTNIEWGLPEKMGLGQFADLRGELGKKEGVVFFFCWGWYPNAHQDVKSGFGNNSVDDFKDVLRRMCQTDPVLSKFQMGRTKLQYVINHGFFTF